jgi:hypothetical protein
MPIFCFCWPKQAFGSRIISAESRRPNGGQVSTSDAGQVRYRQRENRGAEEEQDYSRSPLGPPLHTSACGWIGHRVIRKADRA